MAQNLILTPNASHLAGSAFFPTPSRPNGLTVAFDATIDQGTGADGMTFTFGDPAAGANPTSLGLAGWRPRIHGHSRRRRGARHASERLGPQRPTSSASRPRAPVTISTRRPTLRSTARRFDASRRDPLLERHAAGIHRRHALPQSGGHGPADVYIGWTAATGGSTNRHPSATSPSATAEWRAGLQ